MADEETQEKPALVLDDFEKVLEWKRRMFEELGFQPELAALLAIERVDWHEVKTMIDKGCSLNHVIKILL